MEDKGEHQENQKIALPGFHAPDEVSERKDHGNHIGGQEEFLGQPCRKEELEKAKEKMAHPVSNNNIINSEIFLEKPIAFYQLNQHMGIVKMLGAIEAHYIMGGPNMIEADEKKYSKDNVFVPGDKFINPVYKDRS